MKHTYTNHIILTVALLFCGCSDGRHQSAGPAMPPPEVSTITIHPGEAILTKDLPGRLQAYRTAQVRARVEGIVEKRLFSEGTDVREGQMLYHIDPRTYRAAFDAAKAELTAAQLLLNRYQPLLGIKAISQQEYDSAQAKLKQARAVFAKAKIDFENTRVPAPISGRVGRSLVTEGALVGRGEATHLTTIEQVDPIYANFTQSGADFTALRENIKSGHWKENETTQVQLILENGSVYSKPGRLFFTDLAVEPSTGAISLRAEFPNPKRDLLPGMFVRIRFPQAKAEKMISLPQRAVQMSSSGPMVFIVDHESKVAPRPIKLGGMSGSSWIISEGLAEGEQVMVEGMMKIRPGMVVKPIPWQPVAATPQAEDPKTHQPNSSHSSEGH